MPKVKEKDSGKYIFSLEDFNIIFKLRFSQIFKIQKYTNKKEVVLRIFQTMSIITLVLLVASTGYSQEKFAYINSQRILQEYQEAIDVTTDGAEVILEPGIYTGPGNTNIDFRGKAITVRSVAPSNPAIVAATIVEGHAFSFISGEGINSVLDGLTIAGGSSSVGGGILCRGSSPTIRNCIIRNCSAYSHNSKNSGAIL